MLAGWLAGGRAGLLARKGACKQGSRVRGLPRTNIAATAALAKAQAEAIVIAVVEAAA